jgi:hypothetical protein
MLEIDIRNNNTDSFDKQIETKEYSPYNDGNNEQDKPSNNKNQIEFSEEPTQRSRDHLSNSINFMEEENKKISID